MYEHVVHVKSLIIGKLLWNKGNKTIHPVIDYFPITAVGYTVVYSTHVTTQNSSWSILM